MSGWESLNCPCFTAVCRRILSEYLENQGFVENRTNAIGGILYKRLDIFLELSYDAATRPDYTPSIVLGIGDQLYNKAGYFSGVPMWYILPKNHPQRTRRYWTFSTEQELEHVLIEIKDQFLATVAKPLWTNRETLKRIIKHFQSELRQ